MWFICVWTVAKLKEIDYKCIWYAEILQNTLSLFEKKLNFEYFGQNWALLSKIVIFQLKIAMMVENKKLIYSSRWWKMKKWVIIYDSDSLISTYHPYVLQFHTNLYQLCPNFRWIRTFSVRIRLKFGVWISFDLIFGLYT